MLILLLPVMHHFLLSKYHYLMNPSTISWNSEQMPLPDEP
jgi:hypothetical protein